VDDEIGKILDALERRADADETLVIFTADHGDGIASHRMVTKQVSMYEETTHIPLFVAGPDHLIDGDRDAAQLVSLLDLLPTLCDFGRIEPPEGLWGRSLRPWLEGIQAESPHPYVASEWHTEWAFTTSPGRMIRTPRYKYTRYLEHEGEELYDIANDRGETQTLIDEPDHADALQTHRQLLDAHVASTRDPFFDLWWHADERWRSHPTGYQHHHGPSAPEVG
jgi:choline-sulfatase